MKIRLDYPGLSNLNRQLHVQEEAFVACVEQLDQLVHSVPDTWEGMSATAYVENFDGLKPYFTQTQQIIMEFQSFINEAMKDMKQTDDDLAEGIHL